MKKRILSVFAAVGLLAAMLPAVASASIVDGRPGQYELVGIYINSNTDRCTGEYKDVVSGNTYISAVSSDDVRLRVQENKKFVHVTCQYTDTSGVYEDNAEVAYNTGNCEAIIGDRLLAGGSGRVVAAANNVVDGDTGGNVTVKCTFAKTPA